MSLSLDQIIQALNKKHPLHLYWQNLLANIQTEALRFALEKKLFSYLTQYQSSDDIAQKLALHVKNTDYFLQLLTSIGLLTSDNNFKNETIHYRNSDLTQRYFHSESPQYCGDAFLFRQQVLTSIVSQFSQYLAVDFIAEKKSSKQSGQAWANAALSQIAQEQNAVTIAIADHLSALIPEFKSAEYFLDVGAGAGLISMHFAEKFPQLECTVLELPEVISAIQSNIQQHPAHQRLHTSANDLQHIEFIECFDIIWCSSVLHFVPDDQYILQQLYAALKPNGVLICAHSEIDLDDLNPLVQSYYFNMRLQGNFVPQKGEIATTLMNLGYQNIQTIENVQFPVAPLNVIIARK